MTMNPIAERIANVMAEGTENIALRSGIKGLTEEDVRAGITPEGIAKLWLSRMMGKKTHVAILEQEEREAAKGSYPLLPYSQMVWELEQQMQGIYTFHFVLRYNPEKIETDRLKAAIGQAIGNHPVFRGNEQYYDIVAEGGELRFRLNRILGDGYSLGILMEDICRAYQGLALEPDYYFRYLQQVENHKRTTEYMAHGSQLMERYGEIDGGVVPVRPMLDKEIEDGDEWLAGEYTLVLDREVDNETVCLATAIAIMDYCKTDESALTWAYLGRENEQERHIYGSLHKDIPLRIRRSDSIDEYRRQIRQEIEHGILLSDYPWTLTHPQHDVWKYAVNVLQQPKWEDVDLQGLEFIPTPPEKLSIAYSLLDIEIGYKSICIKYSATHYKEESIIRFAKLIETHIMNL